MDHNASLSFLLAISTAIEEIRSIRERISNDIYPPTSISDMEYIHSLCTILAYKGEAIAITGEAEIESPKGVLRASNPPGLNGYVQCKAIWPTQ